MALSLDISSPSHLHKSQESQLLTMAASSSPSSSPLVSPSSDKHFWSTLRNRVDALLETRSNSNSDQPTSISPINDRAKRMKEDSLLLIRGFDSIASSLSQLTNTLDNALEGARDLAKAPTLKQIVESKPEKVEDDNDKEKKKGATEMVKKRKLDDVLLHGCSEQGTTDQENPAEKNLNKVKNLAVSMAAKSAWLARELKSIKSDLCFTKERCALLEEENRRLQDGFDKGIRPEEDDLVRLQLEALLAEKSRLATENANLTRENQCLRQLVEYHQFASQDLSASYEQVIHGLCLDFSSPEPEPEPEPGHGFQHHLPQSPSSSFEFCKQQLEFKD